MRCADERIARVVAFPSSTWTEDAPPEIYLLGSGVPMWASGGTAKVSGWTLDGREVYEIEDAGEDGRGVVGTMTDDGEFTDYDND